MVKKSEYPVPKFESLKEEDKYWQSHSPLMEDYEGKVQKKKQNRISFLSVRLTAEELSQLREQAIHYGLGPSTYARQLLIQGMESRPQSSIPELLLTYLHEQINSVSSEHKEEYLRDLTKIFKQYLELQDYIVKQMAILRFASKQESEKEEVNRH